jgi:hypothetical protein
VAERRSDIWSFGVVVYELLVGRPPFDGASPVQILGAVLNKEADWSLIPAPALRLLRACLQKDPRQRLAAISDARLLLEPDEAGAMPRAAAARFSFLWPATVAVLLLIAAATAYGWWQAARPVERGLTRFSVDLGPDAIRAPRVTAVLSPDGSRLVFTARGSQDGLLRLYTQRLDEAEATPLPQTNFGTLHTPFFSPDGGSAISQTGVW